MLNLTAGLMFKTLLFVVQNENSSLSSENTIFNQPGKFDVYIEI